MTPKSEDIFLPQRFFGPLNTSLPILGLGCGRIGSLGSKDGAGRSQELLRAALDMGVTLLDTADIYGQGDSERAIGKLVRGCRDRAFVVTKVGKTHSARARMLRPLKPLLRPLFAHVASARDAAVALRAREMSRDFTVAHIREAIDKSLRRLGCDYVDALLLHGPSEAEIADLELQDLLATARRRGRFVHYGVSCDDTRSLEAAFRLPGASLVQIPPALLDDALRLNAPRSERMGILLREVLRQRGSLGPKEAIETAVQNSVVSSVVVGTGSIDHLRELVEIVKSPSLRGLFSGCRAPRTPQHRTAVSSAHRNAGHISPLKSKRDQHQEKSDPQQGAGVANLRLKDDRQAPNQWSGNEKSNNGAGSTQQEAAQHAKRDEGDISGHHLSLPAR